MTPDEDPTDRLKLRAEDAADLATVAAVLQDAVVPAADMAFLPDERRFVLVANRFRWETLGPEPDAAPPTGAYERINCGATFEQVDRVRSRGIDLGDRERMLDLLTMEVADEGIRLIFAGNAEILLGTAVVDCRIEDLGEPWPTRRRPDHGGPDGPAR